MILRKTIRHMKVMGFSLSLLTLIHCGSAAGIGGSALNSNDNASKVLAGEFGDAPDHMDSGYPSGIEALFPTLKASDGANHLDHTKVALGMINEKGDWPATTESDAIDPADSDGEPNLTYSPDQADQDHRDDGLLTLNFGSDEEASLEFSVTAAADSPQGTYYLNVLFDWNKDGEWKGTDINGAKEWAVQNMPVDINPDEEKTLKTPVFMTGDDTHPVWLRLTLSDTPVAATLPDGWTGTGTFDLGETEDYYLDGTQVLPLDKDGVALPGVPLNKRGPQPLPGGGGGGG
ncbi:MAG: Cell surface protein, partial [uncultured bacterium]